jgi:transposase
MNQTSDSGQFAIRNPHFAIPRFAALRKELQEKKLLPEVKARQDQERRWMTTLNHQISRQIVDFAARYEQPVIVLENLTHIREW